MPNLKTAASVSIVVPFHNEESNVVEMYGRLHAVMESLGREHQFVFVDDGSTDLTYKLLKELALIDPNVTVVRLRRNFGQTGALAAGVAHSTGDYVIAMDGDLQHDPSEIPAFLDKIEEGYDIVSGWRSHRVDNLLLRKIPSRCANWLMAKLSGVNIHDFGTTFKAYRGDLLRELPLYGEMHRFIPALASYYGASICEIPIQNNHRKHGESHYNILSYVPCVFRSHDDPISSALHVAPAPLLWPAGRDEHGLGIRYRTLASSLESLYPNRCSAATRAAAGVCGRSDTGRDPANSGRSPG